MKKITIFIMLCVLSSSVFAQDDVSIMDLKETVYILINQVKHLKEHNQKVLQALKRNNDKKIDKLDHLVQQNLDVTNKVLQQNKLLRDNNKRLVKQESILEDEILNMENLLNKYIVNEKQAARLVTIVKPNKIFSLQESGN